MSDNRRSARRVRLSGVRVTYESAAGDRRQADVLDLSREGLFVVSPRPLAVGKRISLEVLVTGEVGPWAALGRVVWVREKADDDAQPAGMAVKFIDIEDSVISAIEGLIEAREPTERGIGIDGGVPIPEKAPAQEAPEAPRPIPSRERTMLGVGIRTNTPAPVVVPAPGREPTLLGVGRQSDEDREPSIAIDSVTPKAASTPPPAAAPAASGTTPLPSGGGAHDPDAHTEPAVARVQRGASVAAPAPAPERVAPERDADETSPSSSAPPLRRRSSGPWLFTLTLLIAIGGVGYAQRARLLPLWRTAYAEILKRLPH